MGEENKKVKITYDEMRNLTMMMIQTINELAAKN
jgi:hypothetical protein